MVINPNNPTGAVYAKSVLEDIVEVARQNDLILFADEIYDKILYDNAQHIPLAQLASDLLVVSFNGLSKAYRVAGFRTGWMVISGAKHRARDYIEGLDILASMRLCANVPTQHAVQTALGGYQSIEDYICPGGRLYEQRNLAHSLLTQIEGVTCVKPKGALYLFPKIDTRHFNITDDERFVMDLLQQEKNPGRSRHRLQPADTRSLSHRLPAPHRRAHRRHHPPRRVSFDVSPVGAVCRLAKRADNRDSGRQAADTLNSRKP